MAVQACRAGYVSEPQAATQHAVACTVCRATFPLTRCWSRIPFVLSGVLWWFFVRQVGELLVAKDWFNAGYIFPQGFKSRLLFRSVQVLAGCVWHTVVFWLLRDIDDTQGALSPCLQAGAEAPTSISTADTHLHTAVGSVCLRL